MSPSNPEKWKILAVLSLTTMLIFFLIFPILVFRREEKEREELFDNITIVKVVDNMPTTKYHNYTYTGGGNYSYGKGEYETVDYSTFQEEYSTYIEETGMSPSVSSANAELYSLCDRYFVVYFGSNRMSPLVPLAMANVETPGRADHDITWSALFPSAVVPIEMMETMDVTTVVSDPAIYKVLSKESSTRDRGALQMSPTYGTGKKEFNSQMSGSEKDKLNNVDTSQYSVWASGAASTQGDRFYIPDVLLRLSSAFTSATEDMAKHNYIPESDTQLIAMCAMYHHRSGVWTGSAHGGQTWNSSDLAYEYSKNIGSQEFIDKLKQYSISHPDVWQLSSDDAMKMYKELYGDPSKYCSSKLVLLYPIKFLYAYVRIAQLYGGY